MEFHKLSLSYSESKDTTGQLTDSSAYSNKLAYRYRISEDLSLSADAKTFDDYYNYNGLGFSFKSSYKMFSIDFHENDKLSSIITFKFEQQNKNYTKQAKEQFLMQNFSIRLDQDLPSELAVGAEISASNYSTSGVLSTLALNNQSTGNTDIDAYSSYFVSVSKSINAEVSFKDVTVGAAYSTDSALLSTGTNSSTLEAYSDFTFADDYTLSASYSRGRSEGSLTVSNTWGLGLHIVF